MTIVPVDTISCDAGDATQVEGAAKASRLRLRIPKQAPLQGGTRGMAARAVLSGVLMSRQSIGQHFVHHDLHELAHAVIVEAVPALQPDQALVRRIQHIVAADVVAKPDRILQIH